ncbi:hypothetical protein [Phenylobacterium sp.]|jgi:hypothetical protein|uniref:hypothetical protein n=1 Tax=Phenylobacterium sp. TaxID=1871053 RepID=UPI002F416FCC
MKSLIAALLVVSTLLAPGLAPAQSAAPQPSAPKPAVSTTVASATGANLNISPKRVTFDRNHRSASVFIFNQGSGPGSFDISLIDRVMLPDGQILPVADAEKSPQTQAVAERVKSAQAILQVSPRRVTLAPGQGQTVRLRIVGQPSDPAVSEVRSHLTIAALPPRDSGTTAEAAAAGPSQPGQLSFQINALLGLSIPAIVRFGDIDIRAGLENPRVSLEKLNGPNGAVTPVLSVDLVRQGANSLFGNLDIRVAGQPKEQPIGIAHGVGVYTEIDRRVLRVPLTRAPAAGEHLEVTFTDDDTSPGKLLAKLTL